MTATQTPPPVGLAPEFGSPEDPSVTIPEVPDGAPVWREGIPPEIKRLVYMVMYARPSAAIAAFRALTATGDMYREPYARMVELCRIGRPAVAAAAVQALAEARRARRRVPRLQSNW
jgi:hypothetical protein